VLLRTRGTQRTRKRVNGQAPPVDVFDLVIFGGTGDLALRKLLPALLHRFVDGQIVAGSRIVGVARDALDENSYRDKLRGALQKKLSDDTNAAATLDRFLQTVTYRALDATQDPGWSDLANTLLAGGERVRVFYLATAASVFVPICERLRELGLAAGNVRVVVE